MVYAIANLAKGAIAAMNPSSQYFAPYISTSNKFQDPPIRPTMPEVQGKWWRVRADGVLGLAKTNFYFEEREFDRKLANGHAEQLFWKSVA